MLSLLVLSFLPVAIRSWEMTHQIPWGLLRNQHVNLFIYIRNIITKETTTFLSTNHCLFPPETVSERLHLFQQFILWNKSGFTTLVTYVCLSSSLATLTAGTPTFLTAMNSTMPDIIRAKIKTDRQTKVYCLKGRKMG